MVFQYLNGDYRKGGGSLGKGMSERIGGGVFN